MPRIHEVPTHLNVEDTLLGSLTPTQLVRLAVCASLAYGVWDQLALLTAPARTMLAGALVLVGLLEAFWQPEGCSLDAWALAFLTFHLAAQQLVWRRPAPDPADWRGPDAPDWADLTAELGWSEPDIATHSSARFSRWPRRRS
jgi:hypothetical protein